MTPVARKYEQQLLASGVVNQNKLAEMKSFINRNLEEAYAKSKTLEYKAEDWMSEEWQSIKEFDIEKEKFSGIPVERVRDLGEKVTILPISGTFHRLVKKIFEARASSISSGKDIDWGTAEALAFSSLI